MRRIAGEAAPTPEPKMLGDKLRLVRRIGKGGMGTVWEAEHTGLHTRVAVKRLSHDLAHDEEFRRRFLREARSAALVKHPHVVEILDVACDDDGVPYLVMELLDGEPLSETLRREGPLPWSRVSVLLAQLTDALRCAHQRGVVHRDIKPGNVILCRAQSPDEAVKLIDFGLAKQQTLDPETRDITHTGELFGSPGYMSPEQLRAEAVDARADVYALGCVAYEMLTGHRPFRGPTVADLVVQHLTQPAPVPAPLDAAASERPAIEALILRALDKDPGRRQQSIAELARDVARVGQAPAFFARARRLASRRWVWGAAAGLVFATVGAGLLLDRSEGSDGAAEPVASFTEELARPLERATPAWPTRWLGHALDLPAPARDPERPDRTAFDVPDHEVALWGADPRTKEPYRLIAARRDMLALSRRAVDEGLTLGHAVDDPPRVEREGRGGDPSTGRVFWAEPRGFPFDAVGTTQLGPGCTGVQIGPVHVLTAAQCVWDEGGFVIEDLRWQPADARGDDDSAVPVVRVYVPPQWPQKDRAGLFDWAVVVTERRLADEYFGITALADDALLRASLHHKGFPLERDVDCEARSPHGWSEGADRPWGNPEPLAVMRQGLRAPSPISGWDRVLGTSQACSTGHAGGPYYVYDDSKRPVVVAIHRSACTAEDGGTAEFCGYDEPWACGHPSERPSQAIRLEPYGLYGHIVPVLTFWGVDASGRAVCLLDGGC